MEQVNPTTPISEDPTVAADRARAAGHENKMQKTDALRAMEARHEFMNRESNVFHMLGVVDLYAARAPAKPLWPFEPKMETERPKATGPFDQRGFPANANEIEAWDRLKAKETALQWPFEWALAMFGVRRVLENVMRERVGLPPIGKPVEEARREAEAKADDILSALN